MPSLFDIATSDPGRIWIEPKAHVPQKAVASSTSHSLTTQNCNNGLLITDNDLVKFGFKSTALIFAAEQGLRPLSAATALYAAATCAARWRTEAPWQPGSPTVVHGDPDVRLALETTCTECDYQTGICTVQTSTKVKLQSTDVRRQWRLFLRGQTLIRIVVMLMRMKEPYCGLHVSASVRNVSCIGIANQETNPFVKL